MAEWLPWVGAAAGFLTALGAFLKIFFDKRNTVQTHANALLDQYQEDRAADRKLNAELHTKVDTVLTLYADERDYSTILLAWGLAGAPPPPPERRKPKSE